MSTMCSHAPNRTVAPLAERDDHAEACGLRARLLVDRAGLRPTRGKAPTGKIETASYRDRFAELVDCSPEAPIDNGSSHTRR